MRNDNGDGGVGCIDGGSAWIGDGGTQVIEGHGGLQSGSW